MVRDPLRVNRTRLLLITSNCFSGEVRERLKLRRLEGVKASSASLGAFSRNPERSEEPKALTQGNAL